MKKYKAGDRMNYTVTEGNYLRFGLQSVKDGVIFTFAGEKEDVCAVILYDRYLKVAGRVEAPAAFCRGAVRSVYIHGLKADHLLYNYEINGETVPDSYASKIAGREKWDDERRAECDFLVCGSFEEKEYEWQSAYCPEIPKNEMVMYKLHVRGFSMDSGKKGKMRGTFAAVEERIPYLKALGVTTVELMPVYEFEEIEIPKKQKLPGYIPQGSLPEKGSVTEKEKRKVNYWGYAKGSYFAPKASYGYSKNVTRELKHLIDTLHQNQMECVMEMYFEQEENQNLILDALRYWATEFRADGFHLIGENVPITAIAQDLYLRRSKIFYQYIPEQLWKEKEHYPHLFVYNDEYLYTGRKLLNHQGGSLFEFGNQQKKQNKTVGFVNFMANNNGFTLADLFSYCEKHNEANGEENTDGSNYNFSINCGTEGKTSRKYVKELRRKHLYMALSMVFFAQGVPLLLAGDEALNSQQGNNNAYCQDNAITWLDWSLLEKNKELFSYVKKLIEFRRNHPLYQSRRYLTGMDSEGLGAPDVSCHGVEPWNARFSYYSRELGVLFFGGYYGGNSLYFAFNFHWEPHVFYLPEIEKNKEWKQVFDTSNTMEMAVDGKKYELAPRSIAVFENVPVKKTAGTSDKKKIPAKGHKNA